MVIPTNSPRVGVLVSYVIVLVLTFPSQGLTVEITNPRITNFGDWGQEERCPDDTVVIGMKLMTEPYQGFLMSGGDDSTLNGIKFICGDPSADEVGEFSRDIHSKIGTKGTWGQEFMCGDKQYAKGFQMRSHVNQGYCDDTAANNLRLVCAHYNNGTQSKVLEGDGYHFGSWTGVQECPNGQAMCSLKTQVGKEYRQREGYDDTGLNNIIVSCCTPKERQILRPAYS